MNKFHDVAQLSDEWFKLKTGLISATDCYTLHMAKTSKAYKDLVKRLSFERLFKTAIEKKFFGNGWTDRGLDLESDAVEEYESETYRECSNGGFYTLGEWLGASPDCNIVDVNGGVEIKCFGHEHVEELLSDPDKFKKELFHQTQFQMLVCGFDFVDGFLYHPAPYKNLKLTFEADAEFIAKTLEEIELIKITVEEAIKEKIKLTNIKVVK